VFHNDGGEQVPIPPGYLAAEEIAVELNIPVYRVQKAAKALGLPQTVYPEDNRRRYSPEQVEKIKRALAVES